MAYWCVMLQSPLRDLSPSPCLSPHGTPFHLVPTEEQLMEPLQRFWGGREKWEHEGHVKAL